MKTELFNQILKCDKLRTRAKKINESIKIKSDQ